MAAIIIISLLCLAGAAYVLLPLFITDDQEVVPSASLHITNSRDIENASHLETLADLELDFALGKITATEFAALSNELSGANEDLRGRKS